MVSVNYFLTVARSFSASHVIPGHLLCGEMHGHQFEVHIAVKGDPDPTVANFVASDVQLGARIDAALSELHLRHLNDALPAIIPSAQGVAGWLWEKLAIYYTVHEIHVWQDSALCASIERP